MWKATAGWPRLCVDEFADFLLEERERLGADVELLIGGLERFDDALVAELEIDGQDELDAVRFAGLDHPLGLLDALGRDVVGLVLVGGVFGDAEAEVLAGEQGVGLFEGHGERAGAEDRADRAAGDHRFEVVELVDLDAAEDDELGLEALLHRAFELAGDVVAEGDALHRQRERSCWRRRGCRRRGLR